ncbi:hypothetical protein BRADI_5g14843v3 [Brachypodium distachyon]|uniref:Uncharacterized protein n=1 Tax=Brachypodium distachyon TaxID=15368 RepID=A0A2K2CH93_BRADI|nr:hypothetical protein BRADI_5g14843v3 [Brachypodium distachyon]
MRVSADCWPPGRARGTWAVVLRGTCGLLAQIRWAQIGNFGTRTCCWSDPIRSSGDEFPAIDPDAAAANR